MIFSEGCKKICIVINYLWLVLCFSSLLRNDQEDSKPIFISVCHLFFFPNLMYILQIHYFKTLKFSGFWIMEKGRETDQITVKILSEEMHMSLGILSFLEGKKVTKYMLLSKLKKSYVQSPFGSCTVLEATISESLTIPHKSLNLYSVLSFQNAHIEFLYIQKTKTKRGSEHRSPGT